MNNEYCISAILIKGYCLIYRTGANLACWPPANKHHAFNGEAMLHLLHFQSDRYSNHTFNKEVLHLLDVQVPNLQEGGAPPRTGTTPSTVRCSTSYTFMYHTFKREVLHLLHVQVPHFQEGGAPPPRRSGSTSSRRVLHHVHVQVPHLQQGGAPPPRRAGTTPSTGRCSTS